MSLIIRFSKSIFAKTNFLEKIFFFLLTFAHKKSLFPITFYDFTDTFYVKYSILFLDK